MSKTVSLIALIGLAAGAVSVDSPAVESGAKFTAPEDVADRMVAAGEAKVEEPLVQAKSGAKRAKVRLLVDSALGNCNDLVEVDAAEVKQLEKDGVADGNKEAVAYAAALPQNRA